MTMTFSLVETKLTKEMQYLYCCECKTFLEENPYWDLSHTKYLHQTGIKHKKYIMYKLHKNE